MTGKKSILDRIRNIKRDLDNNKSKEDDKFSRYLELIHLQQDVWELELTIRKNKKSYTEQESDNLLRLLDNLDNVIKILINANDKVCKENKLDAKKLDNGKLLIDIKHIDNDGKDVL